ncbi:MAG: hypothetical protein Q4G49_08385 [Paracoccus sp. (in: a-proteobacteria)]|nr:hypothetical protein [Paracoccus sp. (in: a-proteobacteria)]
MATFHTEHEIHRRRWSRNAGLGLVLALFVAVVFGLTIVKVEVGQGHMLKGYDHRLQDSTYLPPPEAHEIDPNAAVRP